MKYPQCPYYECKHFETTFEMQTWFNSLEKQFNGLRIISIVSTPSGLLIATIVRESKLGE